MNLITNLRHYVSTWPYQETKDYKLGETYKKNWLDYKIIKIEWEYMLIKSIIGQFCVSINYKFDN